MGYEIYISSKIKKDLNEVVDIANQLNVNIEIKNFVRNRALDKMDKLLPVFKGVLRNFKGKLALHAAFEGINPVAKNPDKRKYTLNRFNQSLYIAKTLNVKTIIFHSGYDTFKKDVDTDWFIEQQTEFWKNYIKNLERTDIIAVIENTDEQTPDILLDIINGVNSDKLKLCIDTGHVNHKTSMKVDEWIKAEGDKLYHMHLHNNYKVMDDHFSLLRGTIDFDKVFETLKETDLHPGLSIEITDYNAAMESLNYIKGHI